MQPLTLGLVRNHAAPIFVSSGDDHDDGIAKRRY